MMMLWACAGVPLGVYNIVQDFNVALKIQPQILTFLSLATWAQCFYYERVGLCLGFAVRRTSESEPDVYVRNGPSFVRWLWSCLSHV
jgi:hypothetical protein